MGRQPSPFVAGPARLNAWFDAIVALMIEKIIDPANGIIPYQPWALAERDRRRDDANGYEDPSATASSTTSDDTTPSPGKSCTRAT